MAETFPSQLYAPTSAHNASLLTFLELAMASSPSLKSMYLCNICPPQCPILTTMQRPCTSSQHSMSCIAWYAPLHGSNIPALADCAVDGRTGIHHPTFRSQGANRTTAACDTMSRQHPRLCELDSLDEIGHKLVVDVESLEPGCATVILAKATLPRTKLIFKKGVQAVEFSFRCGD